MKGFFTNKKTAFSIFGILALLSYGFFVFAAAPGGYAPGSTLDPQCGPNDAGCVVTIPSGEIKIGSQVQNGIAGEVLYTDASQNLIGDADFTRDSATEFTTIQAPVATAETAGFQIGNNMLGLGLAGAGSVYYDSANSLYALNLVADGTSIGQN